MTQRQLDISIDDDDLRVATPQHNGSVRIHIGTYLAPEAQEVLVAIAKKIGGIADVTLLSDAKIIVIEAKRSCHSKVDLRRLYSRFKPQLNRWYSELDGIEHHRLTYRIDPSEAMQVTSIAGVTSAGD